MNGPPSGLDWMPRPDRERWVFAAVSVFFTVFAFWAGGFEAGAASVSASLTAMSAVLCSITHSIRSKMREAKGA